MLRKKSEKKRTIKDDGIAQNVIGLVRTSVLAGIGMAFLGEEKIEEWIRRIAKENKMSSKDIDKFVKDVKKQSSEARNDFEKRLREMMKEVSVSDKEKSLRSSRIKHPKEKKASQKSDNLQKWSVSFIPNKEFNDSQS